MPDRHDPLMIRDIGSFYTGGQLRRLEGLPPRVRVSTAHGAPHPVDQNGDIIVGQMYVEYVRLAASSRPPLLMWHGGGMTGETTPDGRPGWQMFFLRVGFDTYTSDAVERGRAAWAPYPQVYEEAPYFRTAKEAWEETFRFGPAGSWHREPSLRRPHGNLRFPVSHIEEFMCQTVPRWGCNDSLTQLAYDSLLAKIATGAIILSHSQGGNFGLTAAIKAPDRVRAVILLEPSGAPDPAERDPRILRTVPHLFIWGDNFLDHPFWLQSRPSVERWRGALQEAGCDVTWIDLPEVGIHGNSHALMADNNSDQIAGLVFDWLKAKGLA